MTKSTSEQNIRHALAKLDTSLEVEVKIAEVSLEERTIFFRMEREGWIDPR